MKFPARLPIVAMFLLFSFATAGQSQAESNWPGWRGPAGTGWSNETGVPVEWSGEDLDWKVELTGLGQSSPVVWGERIFLTSATDGGRQRIVMCLDRATGKLLWRQTAWSGEPEPAHGMNMHASATCVTDGERVIAFFGRAGIHCYDLEGQKIWSRDLGQFENPWGTAASPILFQDLVIQNCDAEDDASIVGLDKRTGETIWQTPRERLRGWSTPILVPMDGRTEVVVNGERGVNAYDAHTGQELWFYEGDRGRGTPTVTKFEDFLIAVSGRPGAMFAMRPGGSGVVNETHEVWRTQRGGRDLPSPIVIGDFLVVVGHRTGVATCYEAATGRELDRIRLEGKFSASPISVEGLLYIPNETGEVFVIKPDEKLTIAARNQLPDVADEEVFRASITPHRGQLLIRSDRALYCVGN